MSQHDYVLENANGATYRADGNSLFDAIATLNSGATAPTTTFANMWWADTSTNILKRRNNANTAWISVMGLANGVTDEFPGINDGATTEVFTLADTSAVMGKAGSIFNFFRGVSDQIFGIAAGNSATSGANIRLHGSTEADALDIEFRTGSTNRLHWDHSLLAWVANGDFSADNVYSDVWTPSATLITNLDSVTVSTAMFSRNGDIIDFSFYVVANATSTGSIVFRIDPPVASDFTSDRNATGAVTSTNRDIVGGLSADTTNDELLITADALVTTGVGTFVTGSYRVLP